MHLVSCYVNQQLYQVSSSVSNGEICSEVINMNVEISLAFFLRISTLHWLSPIVPKYCSADQVNKYCMKSMSWQFLTCSKMSRDTEPNFCRWRQFIVVNVVCAGSAGSSSGYSNNQNCKCVCFSGNYMILIAFLDL